MDDLSIRKFLTEAELALPRFREADALKAGGLEDDRPDLFEYVRDTAALLFGPDLEPARDWLGKPQRDLLDGKIAQLRLFHERMG